MGLYIPYGSNKTITNFDAYVNHVELYIPYGSNKTADIAKMVGSVTAFISHMVQIKPYRSGL